MFRFTRSLFTAALLLIAAGTALAQVGLTARPVGPVRQAGPDISFSLEFDEPVVVEASDFSVGATPAASLAVSFEPTMGTNLVYDASAERAIAPTGLTIGGAGNGWTVEFLVNTNFGGGGVGRTVLSYAATTGATAGAAANELYFTTGGDMIFRGAFAFQLNPIGANRWRHVAITATPVTDSTELRVYYDGVLQGTTTRFGWLMPDGYFVLGDDQDSFGGGFDPAQAFFGELDELRVWNVARTPAEIAATSFRTVDPASSGLAHYWRFDEVADLGVGGSGSNDIADLVGTMDFSLENSLEATGNDTPAVAYTIEVDASGLVETTTLGLSLDGSLIDRDGQPRGLSQDSILVDVVVEPLAPALVASTQGQPTTGTSAQRTLRFDRSVESFTDADIALNAATLPGTVAVVRGTPFGRGVLIEDPPGVSSAFLRDPNFTLPTGDFTVECWCRPARPESAIFSFASNSANAFLFTADGKVFVDNAVVMADIDLGQNDGRWHHFRVSVEANRITRWIDGVFAGAVEGDTMSSARSGFLVLGQDQDSTGGGFSALQALDGPIDELRVHATATPNVAWDEPADPNTPGLWALYRFEDFTIGSQVDDLVGSQKLDVFLCSITDGVDRGRDWDIGFVFPDERTNYCAVDLVNAPLDAFGRAATFDGSQPVLDHVQVEDLVMSVEVNGGAEEFHRATSNAGDQLLFRLASPDGRFVGDGVPLILAQFPPTGTTPGSVFGFPELRLDLGLGIATVYDGAAGGLFGPLTLPPGGLPVFALNPGGLAGTSVVLQGIVSNGPNTVNGIFAAANVLVVDLL